MTVIARPNLGTALRARLLTFPEVVTLVSTTGGYVSTATAEQKALPRIASQIASYWSMPTRAIRLRRTGGALTDGDYSLGLWRSRIDLFCYGAAGHEAIGLLDVVLPALCPLQGTSAGFTEGTCRVALIEPEADVFADVDPQTGWPFAWVPLSISWLGIPV